MVNHVEENKEKEENELKLLKTKIKTPLERAQERLRRTRLDETSSLSEQEEKQAPEPKPEVKPIEQISPEPIKKEEVPVPPEPELKPKLEPIPEPAPAPEATPEPEPKPTLEPKPKLEPTPPVSAQRAKEELTQALQEKPSPKETAPEPKPQGPTFEKKEEPSLEKPVAPKPEEEKLERLKREEIRTMKKDIKSLREFEVKKERERIVGLQTEPKKPGIMPEPKPRAKPEPTKEELFTPKPPIRPSPLKKIFVRVIIVILVSLVIGFAYWFFAQREQLAIKEDASIEEEQESPEEIVEEPEIVIPDSLIIVKDILTFNATDTNSINNIYNQIITKVLENNEFVRIVIKNEQEKRIMTLTEVTESFQITIPADVLESLKIDTFNLLVYPQEHGKRGVIIAEIKDKEKLNSSLLSWENDIITNGLLVSGNKVTTLSTRFRDYSFENTPFRFLTLSMNDLGICYSLMDDYFLLSTSFKSIEESIKAVKEKAVIIDLKNKAGQMFIVGFEGKTLSFQLEQFIKKYKPGGVLLLSKNIENQQQLKTLITDLQNLSKKETGLPLLIAVDQEGGSVSRIEFLTEKTAQSEISTANYAYAVGLKRGEELKELGVNLNLSPVLDNAQSSDFIYERSFQKTLSLSEELAKSLIKGQKETGILTAIKHFPGYVGIDFNPENKLATTNLPETSQFKKAIEVNPEMVMVSNAIYQDIDSALPFSFSSTSIEFLKNELGSNILIISDDLSQNSLLDNFTLNQIVTKPVLAGVDILIFSGWRSSVESALDEFFIAVEQKQILETTIISAYEKINQLKQGLSE
ncbi:MAG: glycoside hydrolase family 3 N-terminal domain-containing protein [Candidatus Nealsonbacteria bacterium]